MIKKYIHRYAGTLGVIIVLGGIFLVYFLAVQILWNAVMPSLVNADRINIFQAAALTALASILFTDKLNLWHKL